MPLRDYVRSVQGALSRGSGAEPSTAATSSTQKSTDTGISNDARRHLRGDLPSTQLFIPDEHLTALTSTVFRPQDKMTGAVTALHGTLGAPGAYSLVGVILYVNVRLTRTSTEVKHVGSFMIGNTIMGESRSEDIDTYEDRTLKVATATLYDFKNEGLREGKEIVLPFQLSIPPEAEGFQLAPSLYKRVQYFLCCCAAEFDTGLWRKLYVDDLIVKPRDDALASIDSLTLCDPFLMMGPYQELELAKQPRWVQSNAENVEVPCPLLRGWKIQEAQGTNEVRLFAPAHDMFMQKPFPLVLKLSVIAPASYGPKNLDWSSFRLKIPTGASSEQHEVQTWIRMALPNARGGDGISRERKALSQIGHIHWDPVHPKSKEGDTLPETSSVLKNGLDWSDPQLEPPNSRYAGRWASHAIVKGVVKLFKDAPTTFGSREGDFRIYNNINVIYWPQSRYLRASLGKVLRDLSQPIQEEGRVPDSEQPPPYST